MLQLSLVAVNTKNIIFFFTPYQVKTSELLSFTQKTTPWISVERLANLLCGLVISCLFIISCLIETAYYPLFAEYEDIFVNHIFNKAKTNEKPE